MEEDKSSKNIVLEGDDEWEQDFIEQIVNKTVDSVLSIIVNKWLDSNGADIITAQISARRKPTIRRAENGL